MSWLEHFLRALINFQKIFDPGHSYSKPIRRLFETLEQASNMQNIHSLKEVFKDKKIVGLPW